MHGSWSVIVSCHVWEYIVRIFFVRSYPNFRTSYVQYTKNPSRQKLASMWAYMCSIHSNPKHLPCSNLVQIWMWQKIKMDFAQPRLARLGGVHNKINPAYWRHWTLLMCLVSSAVIKKHCSKTNRNKKKKKKKGVADRGDNTQRSHRNCPLIDWLRWNLKVM